MCCEGLAVRGVVRRRPGPAAEHPLPGRREATGFIDQDTLGKVAETAHSGMSVVEIETVALVDPAASRAVVLSLLPTADAGRNAAWLQLAALAGTLTGWLRHLALDGDLKLAEPKTLRFCILNLPARLVHHARYLIVKIPDGWTWADDLVNAWDRLQALHPG